MQTCFYNTYVRKHRFTKLGTSQKFMKVISTCNSQHICDVNYMNGLQSCHKIFLHNMYHFYFPQTLEDFSINYKMLAIKNVTFTNVKCLLYQHKQIISYDAWFRPVVTYVCIMLNNYVTICNTSSLNHFVLETFTVFADMHTYICILQESFISKKPPIQKAIT